MVIDRRTTVRRILAGASVPLVAVLALLVTPAVLHDRLPARVFEFSNPVGAHGWTAVTVVPVVWIVAAVVLAAVAQSVSRPHAEQGRTWVAVQWGFAVSLAIPPLAIVASDLDLTGPPVRPEPWWGDAWWVTTMAVVVAAIGWLAAGRPAPASAATGRPAPDAPRMALADGERLLWLQEVVSRPGLALAALWLVLAASAVAYRPSDGPPLQVLLFLALAAVTGVQSWARVRVDGTGVHVTQPLLRRTLVAARIDEIVQARAGRLERRELPWSAYGVVRRPDRTLYRATRTGELLALSLSEGRRLDVTVPDAATAAALLNSELDRRRAPTC